MPRLALLWSGDTFKRPFQRFVWFISRIEPFRGRLRKFFSRGQLSLKWAIFLSKVPFKGSVQRFLSKVPFKGCFQTSLSKVAFKGSFQRFLPEAKHIPFQRFPLCAPLKGSIQRATCHSRVVFLSCLSKNCYCHKWRRSRALVKLKSKRSILQHSHRRQ